MKSRNVLFPLVVLVAGAARTQEPSERTRAFDLLDNGAFAESPGAVERVPWWKTAAGRSQLEDVDGVPYLRTGPGEWAEQPVPAYAPLASGVVIRGECRGDGAVVVVGGDGARDRVSVGGSEEVWTAFEIAATDLEHALVPRFTLRLEAERGVARWRALEALVPLPAPTPAELRAEIVAELDWIFATWEARGGDRHGTETAFIANLFDVVTGAPTNVLPGGHNTFTDLVVAAADAAPEVEGWTARAERAIEDALELGFHPETGLPRTWDCFADRPDDHGFVEVAAHLAFLLDLAESGPERFRVRAGELAERAGATILARALLPDGEVCPKLRPIDGATNAGYSQLRRLDLPAQLARLHRRTGDAAYLLAALEGVAALEYTHAWAGTWRDIDPGFDDNYGHYGARAVTAWRAVPAAEPFRRLALSGLRYYAPRWWDALRHGGNVAADQVRCWEIFAEIAALEPERASDLAPLLRAAQRSHVKGGQLGDGTWVDVTLFEFQPKLGLQVGDTLGVPQNLLNGLAILHDDALAAQPGGPDLEEVRALFTAVLRATRATFRREYGYLPGRFEAAGTNESIASLRLAVGLVEMLGRL